MAKQEFRYFAFISYKREDEKWAKWLQHKLEHYKLPANVRRNNATLPKDLRPVFKDTSELASGVLADEIHSALEDSQHLIVICSPRSAKSEWVCKEVQAFIDAGRTKDIIPFIVGGKAYAEKPEDECFPTALRQLPSDEELLGVNISEMGKEAACVKVIAQMLGLKFDTLWQRHQKEKIRRTAILSAVAVFLTTMLVASAWIWQKNAQLRQSNQKIMESQSRFIAEKINTLIDDGDSYTATLLALETLPEILDTPNRPYVPESELALRQLAFRHSALLQTPSGKPIDVSFSHDGKCLLALINDSTVLVWDAATSAQLDTTVSFPNSHPLRTFGSRQVSFVGEFGIALTDANEKMWSRLWTEPDDSITALAVSPDQRFVASASKDGNLRIRDFRTGKVVRNVKAHADAIRSVAFSPDSTHIATASADGTAKIWDKSLSQQPIVMKGHESKVFSAIFSPDGSTLLTVSEDKTIKLWNTDSGKLIGTLTGHTASVRNASFSPDGKTIASASYDETIKIWDVQTQSLISTLKGHRLAVTSVEFSPDGKTLASVSWDNTVKLWDLQSGSVVREWTAHRRGIHSVCFSPDGRRLMTASWENTVKIWDIATGRMIHELKGHTGNITTTLFVSDGSMIMTSADDGTIRTWDFLPLQTLIDKERLVFQNRQLTREEKEKYYLE